MKQDRNLEDHVILKKISRKLLGVNCENIKIDNTELIFICLMYHRLSF